MTAPGRPEIAPGSRDAPAPGMNVEHIGSIEQFKSVAGAALTPGTAETWNQLGSKFQSALDAMSRFQQGFSSDAGSLEQSLQGAAGDRFQAYTTDTVLKRSQAVTQAIAGYPQAMRAIGESITSFQSRVAEIEAEFDARMTKKAGDVAKLVAAGTKLGIEVDGNALMQKSRKKDIDTVVLPQLRRALLDLGSSYESNGGSLTGFDMSAMRAPDVSGQPGNGGQGQAGGQPGGQEQAGEPARDGGLGGQGTDENTGDGADSGTGTGEEQGAEVGTGTDAGGKTGTDAAGGGSDADAGGGAGGSESATSGGAGEGTDGGAGAGAGMGTGAGGGGSAGQGGGGGKSAGQGRGSGKNPGEGTGTGAGMGTGAGKPATTSGQPAENSARRKALDDARTAAGRAIDDLMKKSPQAGTSAAADTRRAALDDAKKAIGTAIDGLTGGDRAGTVTADGPGKGKPATTSAEGSAGTQGDKTGASTVDPAREKALSDAKKAAGDAINGLQKGASADSSGSAGGKEGSGLGKGAAGSGSAGGNSGSTSGGKDGPDPAREKALSDAKKAAADAISALQGGSGDSGKAGGKVPATMAQLSQSSAAGGQGPDAAQPKGDQEARRQAQNAINALQAGSGGSPATTGGTSLAPATGPGHGGSPDAPQSPTGQDSRQQMADDAKRTAQRAIDGLLSGGEPSGKGQTSPLASFLSGAGGHSGGLGSIPGGGGHGPKIGGAVGSPGFDGVTRNSAALAAEAAAVARQGGYDAPGAAPAAQPGSYRGTGGSPGAEPGAGGVPPMMMGGAGVGGRHRDEREHSTWLQADEKDWQEGDTDGSSPTIGRR